MSSDSVRLIYMSAIEDQLRSLIRHAPIDSLKLMLLAPDVVNTLASGDAELALTRLWDLVEERRSEREVDAAAAILGFTDIQDNVLHRSSAFDNTVHPRTVRRWAYEGIGTIAFVILELAENPCMVYVRVNHPDDPNELAVHFYQTAPMDDPVVKLNAGDLEQLVQYDEGRTPSSGYFMRQLIAAPGDAMRLVIRWDGAVTPMYSVDTYDLRVKSVVSGRNCFLEVEDVAAAGG